MQIVAMLCCLENEDRKIICVFSAQVQGFIFYLKIFKDLFLSDVYECFSCKCVCVPPAGLVP